MVDCYNLSELKGFKGKQIYFEVGRIFFELLIEFYQICIYTYKLLG